MRTAQLAARRHDVSSLAFSDNGGEISFNENFLETVGPFHGRRKQLATSIRVEGYQVDLCPHAR